MNAIAVATNFFSKQGKNPAEPPWYVELKKDFSFVKDDYFQCHDGDEVERQATERPPFTHYVLHLAKKLASSMKKWSETRKGKIREVDLGSPSNLKLPTSIPILIGSDIGHYIYNSEAGAEDSAAALNF